MMLYFKSISKVIVRAKQTRVNQGDRALTEFSNSIKNLSPGLTDRIIAKKIVIL